MIKTCFKKFWSNAKGGPQEIFENSKSAPKSLQTFWNVLKFYFLVVFLPIFWCRVESLYFASNLCCSGRLVNFIFTQDDVPMNLNGWLSFKHWVGAHINHRKLFTSLKYFNCVLWVSGGFSAYVREPFHLGGSISLTRVPVSMLDCI